MSHRRLAALVTLTICSLPLSVALAGPLPTAPAEVADSLELAATTVYEDDQEASLRLEASAAAGGSVGEQHGGGLATATVGLLAGLRGTSTNWLRFVGRTALPVYFGDEADAVEPIETPRGRYQASARGTVNFAGGYSGFAVFSDARVQHGGAFGVGVRNVSLGPGDFVEWDGQIGLETRWHMFDDAPLLLQIPVAYRVAGAALLDEATATRSAGWIKHAISTGIEISGVPNGPMRYGRFEIVGVEVGAIHVEAPVYDAGPDVRAGANIERIYARGLDGDYLVQLERDLFLGLSFGLAGVMQRSETVLTGVVEHGTFIGHAGVAMHEAGGARMHIGYERRATHSADASEPAIGDNRLELGIALPASLLDVGLSLDATFSWLDDLGRDDFSDPRFRFAIDTEAFYTAFEQLDLGAYYQVERNLMLEREDPTAAWDPWQVGNRVNHEVAAFARWRLDVD